MYINYNFIDNFQKDIDLNQLYVSGFILLIIIVSTIYLICKEEKENFDGKICFNRSKEYLDYKNKIFNRINILKEIEEKNRMFIKYDDENEKLLEMNKLNQDYLSNGESF